MTDFPHLTLLDRTCSQFVICQALNSNFNFAIIHLWGCPVGDETLQTVLQALSGIINVTCSLHLYDFA